MDPLLVEGTAGAVPASESIGCVVPKHDTQEQSAEGETAAMAFQQVTRPVTWPSFCLQGV